MRNSSHRLVSLALVALAAGGVSCATYAAQVQDARAWAGAEHTRIVFDLSGPMTWQLTQDGDQVRLALGRNELAPDFSAPVAQGRFKGLRSTRKGQLLELLASIDVHSTAKSFLLKPGGSAGYRLVLDIYPERDASERAVAASVASVMTPTVTARVVPTSGKSTVMTLRQVAEQMRGQRKVVVAIDAGHGGKDQGAHGPGGTLEKNVTLAVARKLAALVNAQPGMSAVLTRNGDYFIPLKRRYEIARQDSADMFVSIHADAFRSGDAKGSSVWVLSPRGKTSEAARLLADRENSADLIGGVSLDDKDDSLAAVLLDLQQGYAMQASESIAGNVLKALGILGPTHRGHVERANFVVLRSPDVPSILVETAFISNPTEEKKLHNPTYQSELAQAVMGGVRNYFESTPPPGTWFAAEAAAKAGGTLAAGQIATPDRRVATLGSQASAQADKHRVARGESLGSIARRYNVSVGALRSANEINGSGNMLHAGATLTIPSG